MSSLTPFPITGYAKGLQTNKRPFLLPDQAWSQLYNEYVYRERLLKRKGNQILGRLERDLTGQSLGSTVAATLTYTYDDIFETLGLRATEPDAELLPGSLIITIGAPDSATFTDRGDGTFAVTGLGNATGSYVDYATGKVVIVLTASTGGSAITAVFSYFPSLPGMGIWQKNFNASDQIIINEQQTLWWDTKYAYVFESGAFREYITGTTWNGNDSDFFWAYNYQGSSGSSLLFVTNFNNGQNGEVSPDPMYYTNGASWTSFQPVITNPSGMTPPQTTDTLLYQARILIPYYSRMLALNTWEGVRSGGQIGATNYFNRCRFSSLGDPTAATAWRADIFGLGGSLDAPVDEAITGATFVKNTLIVDFEFSTWQLRYVGEYGLPFIWERVSTDFGSGSTFSGVLFDNQRLNVGDVAITSGNSVDVQRIDLDIPDQVFAFQNEQNNNGAQRVWGIRDYQKELVFWCYPDARDQAAPGTDLIYPNKVLLYNYRNNTWAILRDSVTAFGTFQLQSGDGSGDAVTWSSQKIFWNNQNVVWQDPVPQTQPGEQVVVKLNQQGWAHIYGQQIMDDPSLSVTAVSVVSGILQLTIPNHNLLTAEVIYLQGLLFLNSTTFLPVSTDLNDNIYGITVINPDTIQIYFWDTSLDTPQYVIVGTNPGDSLFTPNLSTSIYIGGGQVTLFPKPDFITKDINLYRQKGLQSKLSRVEFLMEPDPVGEVTINFIQNTSPTSLDSPYAVFQPMSLVPNLDFLPSGVEYQWFVVYQTLSNQYFRIEITYSDAQMNQLTTHQSNLTLYAINAWTRQGGRVVNP